MLRAESARRHARVLQLVRLALGERDREGLDRLFDQLTHHGRDGRRVNPTRQEHPQRHVRHQTQAHRRAEQFRPLGDVIVVAPAHVAVVLIRREAQVPILFDLHFTIAPAQGVAGQQAAHAAKERFCARRRMVRQIVGQRRVVQLRRDGARDDERLDLRGEVERAVRRVRVVERLDAEPVAGDEEFTSILIPDGEGEHAAQEINATRAVLFVEVQDRLRVAVRAIAVTARFEVGAIVCVVIDLAVIDDVQSPILVLYRLMTAAHVHDGEPAHSEADAPVQE